MLFIVDEPSGYTYYGSLTAAPYAGRIFAGIADCEMWERSDDGQTEYIEMPEVIGMDAAEAVAVLEKAGLNVELCGEGKVISTTPAPFTKVPKGDVVLVRAEDSS